MEVGGLDSKSPQHVEQLAHEEGPDGACPCSISSLFQYWSATKTTGHKELSCLVASTGLDGGNYINNITCNSFTQRGVTSLLSHAATSECSLPSESASAHGMRCRSGRQPQSVCMQADAANGLTLCHAAGAWQLHHHIPSSSKLSSTHTLALSAEDRRRPE